MGTEYKKKKELLESKQRDLLVKKTDNYMIGRILQIIALFLFLVGFGFFILSFESATEFYWQVFLIGLFTCYAGYVVFKDGKKRVYAKLQEINENNIEQTNEEDTKECPQCAEIIKKKAKICRFCNYKFD